MGKKVKAPVLIASKAANCLEEAKWTDKVFTGDNSKNSSALTFF